MASKTVESYNNYKMFKCFKRKFKIKEAGPPEDVKQAFSHFAAGGTDMSADQLRRFMVEHQGEMGVTEAEAEGIVRQVLARRNDVVRDLTTTGLDLQDFFYLLFHDDLNGAYRSQVHHDMTAPLSHYFIYTGHNSYLTGNQLSSDCSDVPIIKALQRGVRVIELDLWPASKDEIHVLHGRTLTTPVPLINCLKSIKEYAFVKSPYPVIITLEDHLTPELQAKVAEMITQTLGDMLYYPESDCLKEFPSPESLKHRIIISTKPPKEFTESKNLKDKANTFPNGKESPEEETSGKQAPEGDLRLEFNADDRSDSDQEDEENNVSDNNVSNNNVSDNNGSNNSKPSQPAAAHEYKRLITIHAGKAKGGLKNALRVVSDKVRRLSLNEQALEKAAASYSTDLVRFTQRNVLRVYPKGARVNSSNFKPIIGWMHGAQMVAFNMQGYGKSLWLMHGMFRANGGCGYVKKPEFLMFKGPRNEVFDPERTLPPQKRLKVKVYMGDGWRFDFSQTHFDTYSPPDFYTKVYIAGVPADCAKKKTKVIDDDWAPVWDEEFTFPLTVPELALLRIEVREHDRSLEKDDFGGQTCLPVSDIKPGIRAVPLYDKKGEKFKSVKLLMRFQFI
ncbi:Phosphoinositide phospholipase C family [Parasponia andersonii]|uniref:Phosphoinositide phospholipase C n=1 Tax=Parasponia andersonii TaxID=3476 RepID=A0A2P5ALY4_PARAD|nr:Phosphoinositide phospholipase C family [Parasponia andersonii]